MRASRSGVLAGPAGARPAARAGSPEAGDDAWVIFTSGSTGTPKGVAVTHRSAAAFVDAEARLFLQDRPLGPGDRVLAGLSVAFDASCEEMWLAWRHGACLVPAPRALVRSGMDLAPWLVDRGITVVSTVPTLASLWPPTALDAVRLLIFGGEACPPELADRLAVGRARGLEHLRPDRGDRRRLRRPAPGRRRRCGSACRWTAGTSRSSTARATGCAEGEIGELIIGGRRAGPLPRRDPERTTVRADADAWAGRGPTAAATWSAPSPRAWCSSAAPTTRSRSAAAGSSWARSTPPCSALDGRRRCGGGGPDDAGRAPRSWSATSRPCPGVELDRSAATRATLRRTLPAPLVPLLAVVDDIPTRTSGKVDRDALPWPLDVARRAGRRGRRARSPARARRCWLAGLWARVLGTSASDADADFFVDGGGSLSAAQLVAADARALPAGDRRRRLREPSARAAGRPPGGARAGRRGRRAGPLGPPAAARGPRSVQQLVALGARPGSPAARWLVWVGIGHATCCERRTGRAWLPHVSWWWLVARLAAADQPAGPDRPDASLTARLLLRGVRPGKYPRGGSVHLRLWAAELAADTFGATNLSCAPLIPYYAKALGAKVGRGVTLHTLPPVTGLMTLGKGASVEPEVDLSGHWLDGDVLRVGRVRVGAGASVGSRSILLPGARVGQDAEVAPGSADRRVGPAGRAVGRLAGQPARCRPPGLAAAPAGPPASGWVPVYAVTARVPVLPPAGLGRRRPRRAAGRRCAARPTPADALRVALVLAAAGDGRRARRPRAAHPGRRPAARPAACARATTRCAAGSAGRSGRPSG